MDTKLKSKGKIKRTIGTKLLLSYLVILAITFGVSMTVYNNVSHTYLVNKATESLEEEVTEILKLINMSNKTPKPRNIDNVAETIVQARLANEIRLAGRYFDSKIVIVTKAGEIRYSSVPNMTMADLKVIAQEAVDNTKYIFKREALKLNNTETGYIVVYSAVEDVVNMRKLGFQVFALSFGIGAVLALLVSLLFQRVIGKPIKKLSHAMNAYSFSEPIQDLNINTGDEIEELAETFGRMSDKIQTYHGQQKVFFQNASHELKTPLMSIQGYAEAIKDEIVEGEERDESLDIIIAESQRLKKIVEEMILLTKLEDEQEPFDFREATIEEIVKGSMRSLSSLFNQYEIDIDLKIASEGFGSFDVDKLTRAFINILGNCARYAKQTITVKVQAIADIIYIEIYDDGDGFAPGEAARVFERFYKGAKGGSGIGLALTKTIIERHNGEVWAEDNPSGGAMFKIKIVQPRA